MSEILARIVVIIIAIAFVMLVAWLKYDYDKMVVMDALNEHNQESHE